MLRVNQQGQLIELSLKQRDQMFAYREQTEQRLSVWQALRIQIPPKNLIPTPPPSPRSVAKAMARYN